MWFEKGASDFQRMARQPVLLFYSAADRLWKTLDFRRESTPPSIRRLQIETAWFSLRMDVWKIHSRPERSGQAIFCGLRWLHWSSLGYFGISF
jgi:hypothetical protein